MPINPDKMTGTQIDVRNEMVARFNSDIWYEEGSKYVKVCANNSAHSFIVKKAAGRFNTGDILKAASWKVPAKNFARGNLFATRPGKWERIRWTGAY